MKSPLPRLRCRPSFAVLSLAAAASAFAAPGAAAPAERPFRLPGLDHVNLAEPEVAKAQGFYGQVLGFDAAPSPGGQAEPAAVRIRVNDRQTLRLWPALEAGAPAADRPAVAWATDNAAALRGFLAAHGAAPSPLRAGAQGERAFTLADPDGHALEFVQAPPPAPAAPAFPPGRIASRLSSVSLATRDLPAELKFYRDLLGFPEEPAAAKGAAGVTLRVPDGTDTLVLLSPSPLPTPVGTPVARGVLRQFALEAAEAPSAKARTIFFDPDGTRVEIVAPAYGGGPLAKIPPTRQLVYKHVAGRDLVLHLFSPAGLTAGDRRPCLVAIHGGGWTSGDPHSMFSFAARAAELGLVGCSVQYRLLPSGPGVTVYDCVKDGRSALRYLRAHAPELGIDPNRIAVIGSSAGGHVAAGTALLDGIDEAGEDTGVSCVPNAVILLSAVLDTSPQGYGTAKAGAHWQELSPVLHVHAGLPPTIVFHGTGDLTTPFLGAREFHDAMVGAGNRCDFVVEPGASHTYYGKDRTLFDQTLTQIEAFLGSLGYLGERAPLAAEIAAAPAAAEQVDVFVSGREGYHTFRIPAVLRARNGDLLGFCEGRKTAGADAGEINLVMKRSRDGGRTWGPLQVVWADGPNTCGNPCPVLDASDGSVWLLLTHNLGQDKESAIVARKSAGTRTVWVTHSTDDGATWSPPVDITATTKDPSWTWYATGPGIGIQLQAGPQAGRLVVPCDHTRDDPTESGGRKHIGGSHVIYSDDHGQTWKLGGTIEPKVNECQVAELFDGRGTLLMNMRSGFGRHRRAESRSADGGITWTAPTDDAALLEPVCQGSLIRTEPLPGGAAGWLLFSNPAALTRRNLTVKVSADEGTTWQTAAVLHPGPAAYSSLVSLAPGESGCLYECGEKSANERIAFARFAVMAPQ